MSEDAPRLPDPRLIPASRPPSWFEPVSIPQQATAPQPVPEPAYEHVAGSVEDGAFVRPFIVTGGRTRPLHDGLRIETLVQTRPSALSAPLRFEQRRIVELARNPVSVAEVTAAVGVPLGVARVLIADLYTGGFVTLHEPTELPLHVIERIRDLVQAL